MKSILTVLVAAFALTTAARAAAQGAACDRTCLLSTADAYIANPFDLEAAHIYKIYGGKIHEIEAMGFTLPLYSRNGWSPFLK